MNWRDAYEQKVAVWKFWHTEAGRRYAEAFAKDVRAKGRSTIGVENLRANQAYTMLHADPIFISAEMVELAMAAAETFQPEPFLDTDLITPAGFALLESPIYTTDAHGKTVSTRALAWAPCASNWVGQQPDQPGILLSLYSHYDEDGDYYSEKWKQETGSTNPFPGYDLTLYHSFPWRFGEDIEEYIEGSLTTREQWDRGVSGIDPATFNESQNRSWRLHQSMFRLMVQKISTVETKRVDRAARRRAQRADLGEKDVVTVVTLRRAKPPSDSNGGSDVQWSHRWMVRGHWRNQYFPSIKRHRQIWISPYIKGPDDKELRIKPIKAWELVR